MGILERREAEIPLNGGMDDTAGAEYQSVATMRNVLDLRWSYGGELEKRPATASTQAITDPSGGVYADLGADAVIEARGEPYLLTESFGMMNSSAQYVGQTGQPVGWTLGYANALAPKACRVGRLTVEQTSASNPEQGIYTAASCVYNSTTLVTATVVMVESGSGAVLRLQAVDITTGTILAQAQLVNDVVASTDWAVDACENTDATTPGAVITLAIGSGAPYTISKYRYRAGTQDFISDGSIETNALSVRHRIVTSPSAAGRFIIAYEKTLNLLFARDATCTAYASISTHVGTHSAIGGTDIVVSGTKVMIVSVDSVTISANVYTERFGTPATAFVAYLSGFTENVLSVTAARETSNGSADRAVLFISSGNSPGSPVPAYYTLNLRTVSFSATTTSAVAAATGYNGLIATSRACTHNDRAFVFAAPPPLDGVPGPSSGILVRAAIDYAGVAVTCHMVARVCHDTLADATFGLVANLNSSFVVGNTVYASLTSDFSPLTMENAYGKLAQTLSLSRVEMGVIPTYAKHMDCATVAAGFCFDVDGQRPQMSQPQFRPFVTLDNRAGGALTGTFMVIAVYTWVDAAGRLHRSQPSAAVSSGALVNRHLDVYVQDMALPAKHRPRRGNGRRVGVQTLA